MPERTVTSPVGETVLVFGDDDYLELAGLADAPANARAAVLNFDGARLNLLASLWREGAAESPKSGLAMRVLGDRAGVSVGTTLSVLKAPIVAAGIERVGNTRRTHLLRLVALPDRWHRRLTAMGGEPASVVEAELDEGDGRSSPGDGLDDHGPASEAGTDVDAQPPASIEVPVSPLAGMAPVEVELANAVATALLAQVIDIVATGDKAAPQLNRLVLDVKALEERLGTSTEYVDKLRRQLRDTGDELAAVKHERDGLRARLRATEHNLRIAVGADAQRIIDIEVRKQVDRVMREAPAGAGSRVAAS